MQHIIKTYSVYGCLVSYWVLSAVRQCSRITFTNLRVDSWLQDKKEVHINVAVVVLILEVFFIFFYHFTFPGFPFILILEVVVRVVVVLLLLWEAYSLDKIVPDITIPWSYSIFSLFFQLPNLSLLHRVWHIPVDSFKMNSLLCCLFP